MHERGLLKKPKRRWLQTTDRNHSPPNLSQSPARPRRYGSQPSLGGEHRHLDAFVYLEVILDLFAHRAMGYASPRNSDTALRLEVLRITIADRGPPEEISQSLRSGCSECLALLRRCAFMHGFKIRMALKETLMTLWQPNASSKP